MQAWLEHTIPGSDGKKGEALKQALEQERKKTYQASVPLPLPLSLSPSLSSTLCLCPSLSLFPFVCFYFSFSVPLTLSLPVSLSAPFVEASTLDGNSVVIHKDTAQHH